MTFKLELSPQNFHHDVLNPLYSVTRKRRKLTEPETYLEKRFMSYLLGTQASKRFPFQTTAFFRLNIGLRKPSIIREFCY